MRNLISCLTILSFFVIVNCVEAHQKIIVVPLLGSSGATLDNVITVSPSGGDFTDPVAAVNSISDNSSTNRYLVIVGPGEYTLTQPLVLKPYVEVRGSGKDVTTLTGALSSSSIGSSSAIVVGAANSGISDLSIRNEGGGNYSIGIYNSDASYDIANVDIQAWGSAHGTPSTSGSYGVYNSNYSHPTISNSFIYGSGKYASGVHNDQSSPDLKYVELDAWVDEGLSCCTAFGMSSTNSSNPTLRYSLVRGSSYGFQQDGGKIRVSYSTIKNLIDTGGTPDIECMYSDNGEGKILAVNCYNLITP